MGKAERIARRQARARLGRTKIWRDAVGPHLERGERRISYCHYQWVGTGRFHTVFLTDRRILWAEMNMKGRYLRVGGVPHHDIEVIGPVDGQPGQLLLKFSRSGESTVLFWEARQATTALTIHGLMLDALEQTLGARFSALTPIEDADDELPPPDEDTGDKERDSADEQWERTVEQREENHARLLELREKYNRRMDGK